MSGKGGSSNKYEEMELRRGPWTLEEDTLLIHYIAFHGEGRWNLLARCSGLKRTGKSCRLRWLNYLKPDIKRGNLSPEEQLLILELHSKWGNRWSRIAQYLPGRTDNEIKNYWRTRVQKQARKLKIDANSTMFRDAIFRCYWMMPRLMTTTSHPQSTSNMQQAAHDLHVDDADVTAAAIDQHLQQPPPQPRQDHHPLPDQLFHNRTGGGGGGADQIIGNQLPSTASSVVVSAGLINSTSSVLLPQRVPILPEFSSNTMMDHDELISLNGASDEFNSGYGALGSPGLAIAAMTPSSEGYAAISSTCSTSTDHNINNCMMNSIGDSLCSMDELYGMLKSYMDGAESFGHI